MKKFFALLLIAKLFGSEPLVVGTVGGYAPFASLDASGNLEGFDIDVAELLAKRLGRKLVIRECGSMPGLMLSLQQKKVDAIIWAISITAEREKKMNIVYYQGERETEMPFLFWEKVPKGISTIADLRDKGICVEAGTFQEGVLKKFPQMRLKNVDKITDAILEIRFGKSLAAAVDPSLVSRFQAQYPKELKVVKLPLPPEEQSSGIGICINKGNQELFTQVKKAMKELRAEGKIAELEKKWGL